MNTRRHLFLILLVLTAVCQRVEALNFSVNTITNVGPGPAYVAVADVNNDGKPDLISVNHDVTAGNTLTVLTNNGSGVFGSNATLTVGSGVSVVVAADLNGDGKPDLVANNSDNVLTVLTNDGSGLFLNSATVTTGPAGSLTFDVVAVDVNGDGRLDLVCANYLTDTLAVFTNSATGIHFYSALVLAAGSRPIWVAAADMNGDGKPDLITANYNANSVTVCTNNGSGVFSVKGTVVAGPNPRRVTVADLNGDGKPDLVVANAFIHQLTLLTNNGSGSLGAYASAGVDLGGAGDVVMADVNGDGRPDLISANSTNNTLTVITNSSTSPAFAYNATLTLSAAVCQPFSVAAADLNGDGKLDLVTANYGNNTLSVLLNTNVFPSPKVAITQSGSNVIVSWAAWSGGFILQTNGNLAANSWNTYGGAVTYDGLKNTVTNPIVKNLFFRLKK